MSDPTQDRLRDHEYDGIQEYDNRLPNWWLVILYATIVFGIVYWAYSHTLGVAATQEESYRAEIEKAADAQLERMTGQELSNESLLLMSSVTDRVASGRGVFEQFCVVCHLEQGQGSVGPNLTDEYFLHGRQPMQIHGTITNGVTDKGMAAWGNQLGPRRVNDVTAYVLTLIGTNVPGKEPQGDPIHAGSGGPETIEKDGSEPGTGKTD